MLLILRQWYENEAVYKPPPVDDDGHRFNVAHDTKVASSGLFRRCRIDMNKFLNIWYIETDLE